MCHLLCTNLQMKEKNPKQISYFHTYKKKTKSEAIIASKAWILIETETIFPHVRISHVVYIFRYLLLMLQNPLQISALFSPLQTEQFTVLWILFATIVLGNSAVLITLYLNKRKSRMNFFIKQLAFAGKYFRFKNDMETMILRIDKRLNLSWFTSKNHMSAFDVQRTSFTFKNGL